MTATFEMEKTRGGVYRFVLKTARGTTVLTSEPHRCRAGALAGIKSVRQNAARLEWFERRQAATGRSYFVLTTARGRVLGCGSIHASRRTMEHDIHSVMTHGPAAAIVDTGDG